MSELRIGTCSWKYDSWRDLVYSQDPKINYLKEYSQKYNTVEVDQWFWSLSPGNKIALPKPEIVSAYNLSVTPNFRFSIKMPNSITLTHHYNKSKSEPLVENKYFLSREVLENTLSNFSAIKDKLGPLMFQFEYLNKLKMPSLKHFIDKLEKFFQDADRNYLYALEIRNPNYLSEEFFRFIERNHLVFVFLQGYYMPDIADTFEKFNNYISGTTVIRLHGPDRSGIEELTGGNWSKIVSPKDSELKKIVNIIKELQKKDVDVYLNVNNHYEGSAPLTIDKINKLL